MQNKKYKQKRGKLFFLYFKMDGLQHHQNQSNFDFHQCFLLLLTRCKLLNCHLLQQFHHHVQNLLSAIFSLHFLHILARYYYNPPVILFFDSVFDPSLLCFQHIYLSSLILSSFSNSSVKDVLENFCITSLEDRELKQHCTLDIHQLQKLGFG